MKYFFTISLLLFSVCCFSMNSEEKPTFHICTVGSYNTPSRTQESMKRLIVSCKRLNIPLNNIGENLQYKGNFMKIVLMLEFLENIPGGDVVLFTDASDVFYLASKEEILEKFYKFNSPIVFSVERNCYPPAFKDMFPKTASSFKYLNCGGYIGYAENLRHFLADVIDKIPVPGSACDQEMVFTYLSKNFPKDLKFDDYCEIFLSLFEVNISELEINFHNKRIFCRETRSFPCIFHGNGDKGKSVLYQLYDLLFR